jgi:polyisoprenyl-teichoic acid--peptidoglycan teichoic acid transferase
MTQRQVELMKHNIYRANSPYPRPVGSKLWKVTKTFLLSMLVILIVSLCFSWKVISSQNSIIQGIAHLPIISQIRTLFGADGFGLAGAQDDRVNFLLLGQGGVGHEGPYLTDTMIVISVKPSTGQAAMLSIPRDLSVLIPGYGFKKINNANSIGEVNEYEGGGSAYAAKILEDVLDIPIHYWLRVDFEGFITTINKLGGINVCVDQPFSDNQFPTADYATQTISFKAGCQKMDGLTALEFARSRHGDNNEGSDFARSKRQQKIILAIKDDILNWKTAISPNRIYSLISAVKNNTQTNIQLDQIPNFLKLAKKIDLGHVTQKSLDASINGYLKNFITEQGEYVLVPRTGNYNEIKYLAENIFKVNEIEKETANLVILNGTKVTGLAQSVADELVMLGLKVLDVGNSPETVAAEEYEKTVIYKLNTEDEKKEALKMIKQQLGEPNLTEDLPPILDKYFTPEDKAVYIPAKTNVDFLIVIGLEQAKKMEEEGKIKLEEKSVISN